MPIYEYQCGACGQTLEVMQKMSEPPLTVCPHCEAASLKKLISASGFQLKGTGWYATDFKNKGKPETKSEGTAPTESKTSGESSSTTTTGKENPT